MITYSVSPSCIFDSISVFCPIEETYGVTAGIVLNQETAQLFVYKNEYDSAHNFYRQNF